MRCIVMVKATKDSEAGIFPSEKLIAEMHKFNEELAKAGIQLAAAGLTPSSKGKRVRFSGSKRTVIDGPFTETKELIAGFWLWQIRSIEEAVEWLKRAPFDNDTEVEIRPVYEMEDWDPASREGKAPGRALAQPNCCKKMTESMSISRNSFDVLIERGFHPCRIQATNSKFDPKEISDEISKYL